MANLKVTLEDDVPVPRTSAPDTGLFTISDQSQDQINDADNNAGIIGFGVFVLVLSVLCLLTFLYKRYHSNSFRIYSGKRIIACILGFSIILGIVTAFNVDQKESTPAIATSNDSLSITVNDKQALSITPSAKGEFGYTYHDVTVTAATTAGYNLSAYASSSNLTNTSDSKKVISSIDSTTKVALSTNTWGVSTTKPTDATSAVWVKMPTDQNNKLSLKDVKTATTANNTTKVYYGVNVNQDLPDGDYINTINYVAVAYPEPEPEPEVKTINNLTYMQDFKTLSSTDKASVLSSMTENQQYTLKDKRDNKEYFIAKLADGNVWMTQNLDFDINSNVTYTPDDTNLSSNWKPSKSTYATNNHTWGYADVGSTINYPESYDPGSLCWNGSFDGDNNLLTNATENCSGREHYSIGNYYNWAAAIATNNASNFNELGQVAEQSICPAGWKLPNLTDYNDVTHNLSLKNGQTYGNAHQAPVYFVYNGSWDGSYETSTGGNSSGVGFFARYWANTAYDTTNAYTYFFNKFDGEGSISLGGINRETGYPVRCNLVP